MKTPELKDKPTKAERVKEVIAEHLVDCHISESIGVCQVEFCEWRLHGKLATDEFYWAANATKKIY